MPYAWDLPAASGKQLRIVVGGKERLINILEIGSQIPFRFPVRPFLSISTSTDQETYSAACINQPSLID